MKKIIILLFIVCIAQNVIAQINAGNYMAGGAVSFRTTDYSESDNSFTQFDFLSSSGYFFRDKLAAGLKVFVSFAKSEGQSFRDFGFGPFLRYYFLKTGKPTNLFVETGFLLGNQKYLGTEAEGRFEFGLSAGPVFFINKNIAVEAILGWKRIKYEGNNGHSNQVGAGVGFQIHLF